MEFPVRKSKLEVGHHDQSAKRLLSPMTVIGQGPRIRPYLLRMGNGRNPESETQLIENPRKCNFTLRNDQIPFSKD